MSACLAEYFSILLSGDRKPHKVSHLTFSLVNLKMWPFVIVPFYAQSFVIYFLQDKQQYDMFLINGSYGRWPA